MNRLKRIFSHNKNEGEASTNETNQQDSSNEIGKQIPPFRVENLAICTKAGFKVASSLPTEWDRHLRPTHEIAARLSAIKALVLWLMVPSDNLPSEDILQFVATNDLRTVMTEDEKNILESDRDDAALRNMIGWKFENAWSLAWYFGYAEPEITGQMMTSEQMQDILANYCCPFNEKVDSWSEKQTTRSESEIIQKEDLFYCLHNAARSAQMGEETAPDGFDPIGGCGVIHERRHSLTWMLSNGMSWEETDLST